VSRLPIQSTRFQRFSERLTAVVLGNWRAVYGAPDITAAQRAALTDMVVKASKSKSWTDALAKNNWTPALLTGKTFVDFVDDEFARLRGIMHLSGMV
jgi:putative tricarboxylic transport membrane protein